MTVLTKSLLLSVFFLSLVAQSRAQWVRSAKSQAFSRANAVATDFSGNVFTAGIFSCITAFEDDSLLNNSCGEITPPAPAEAQVDAFISKYDENGNLLWVHQFKGSTNNILFVNDIGVDAAGNCYVAGAFTGNLDLDVAQFSNPDATTEMFLVKILADGTTDWAVSYGLNDLSESAADKLAVTADAVYITGAVRGDFTVGTLTDSVGREASFVASYDLSGNALWTKHFMEVNANGSSRGKAIEARGDSLWVFSSFTDSVTIEGNVYRPPGTVPAVTAGVICLYNATGILQSQVLANTPLIERIRLHRPDGKLYITGRAEGITAIGEDTLFTNAGIRAYVSAHGLDLAATDNLQWVTALTAPSSAGLTTLGLDVDDDGNVYAAGVFDGASLNAPSTSVTGGTGHNGFLLKLNSSGNDLWLQAYGGAGDDALAGVSARGTNRIYTAGYFNNYIRVAGDEIQAPASNGMTARIDICPQVIADMVTADTTYVCDRDAALFEVTTNAAYTYQWYKDALPLSGAGNATLNVKQEGVYYARITSGGCTKFTPTAKLFVNPLPDSVVLTNDPMDNCEGDVVKLNGPLGTYTFQWLDDGIAIPETAKDISVSVDGDYQVRVTDGLGCSILSKTFPIRFLAYPASTLTPAGGRYKLCSGNSLLLQADQSQPGMTWQWQKDGIPLVGEVSADYAVTTSGTYHAVLKNQVGCETVTEADTVIVQASPVVDLNDENLPGQICQGNALRLVTPLIAGQTYQWRRDGVDLAGANTNALDVSTGGAYSVHVANTLCAQTSSSFTLVVNSLPTAAIDNATSTAICEGDAYTLNAVEAPDYTYEWLRNDQPIAAAVQPALSIDRSGNYSVRITNAANCQQVSAATSVVVNLKPPAVIYPQGATTFCAGDAVELLANAGTALSYQWRRDGIVLAGSVQQAIATSEGGRFEVVVTNSNQCSGVSAPVEVQVVPIPVATIHSATGTTSICERDSVELKGGIDAAYDFTWYFNNQRIDRPSSSTYYAKEPGDYHVVAAVGSCRDTASVLTLEVKPNPLPVITRNEAFLSIAQFGDIQWYRDATPIPDAGLQVIRADGEGVYSVNVINAEGCSAWSSLVPICLPLAELERANDVLTVSIDADQYNWRYQGLPVTGAHLRQLTAQQSGSYSVVVTREGCTMETQPVTVCIPYPFVTQDEFTGVLLASPNPAAGYQWYFDGTLIPGATTQVHIPESAGVYSVTVRDLEGCVSSSTSFTITPVTGLEQGFAAAVRCYPNPANDRVIIENAAGGDALTLCIYDATGRQLQQLELYGTSQTVNVAQLAPGVYTVVVHAGRRTRTWKLVKQ